MPCFLGNILLGLLYALQFFKFEYFHLLRQKKKQKKLNAKRKRDEGKKEEGGKSFGYIKGERAPAIQEQNRICTSMLLQKTKLENMKVNKNLIKAV